MNQEEKAKEIKEVIKKRRLNDNLMIVLVAILLILVAIIVYVTIF